MMLFPELSEEKSSKDFYSDRRVLKSRVDAWAQSLGGYHSVEIFERKISVGKLIVHHGGFGKDSAELRAEKVAALARGLELYYIYPWELDSLDLIFSHFQSRLGMDERKFAAKRLKLEKIAQREADSFMEANHIQGSARGSQKVSYGLRLEESGELLAVQQYCKSRWMLKKLEENPGIWEGLRLASKRNVQIYGAATRLQKAFLKEYNPTELMSYVDFSHSLGSYKEIQGFSSAPATSESYMWALVEEPKSVPIVDKDGNLRLPNLSLVKETPYLNPSKIAGAFGKGVGQTFYGGKLGSRKELLEKGNEFYHNDLILEQLGYSKIFTAGQLKWRKTFGES